MSTSRVKVGWPALVAGGIALLAAGAGIAYVAVRPASPSNAVHTTEGGVIQPSAGTPPSTSTPAQSAASEVVITLTPEAIQRAGIVLAPVTAGRDTSAPVSYTHLTL